MIEFFTSHFLENAKLNSENEEESDLEDVDLTDWMQDRQFDFQRCMHVFHDIEHILVSIIQGTGSFNFLRSYKHFTTACLGFSYSLIVEF